MKRLISFILAAVLMLLLCACGAPAQAEVDTPPPEQQPAPPVEVDTRTRAERLLADMTLEEKVGQLFLVRPDALDTALSDAQVTDAKKYGVTAVNDRMTAALEKYPVGGVVLFAKNIADPAQLTDFLAALQAGSKTPLLTGIDEEGGAVARIANSKGFTVTKYESMAAVGATGDAANARTVGETIGGYLRQYGFNLDFAPVADVNTNPKNIVIGDRSFGSDPALVADMVAAEIEGLHAAGVMSAVKHFPGHGDTTGDTHDGFVSVNKTWAELQQCELLPFLAGLATTDMVMAAHITVPNITTDGLPASLSHELLTDRLRRELGYNGVIITDSLSMGAITTLYSPAQAAVLAVQAGVDILLMPEDLAAAYTGVYDAVTAGEITTERLEESVLRILTLKEQYGLLG